MVPSSVTVPVSPKEGFGRKLFTHGHETIRELNGSEDSPSSEDKSEFEIPRQPMPELFDEPIKQDEIYNEDYLKTEKPYMLEKFSKVHKYK